MKPYYEDDWATIYHGDCREILPTLGRVDLVLTDPPYGISLPCNYKSRGRSVLADCNDYEDVIGDDKPFEPLFLLDYGKNCIIWGGNNFASKLPDCSGWLVWDKEIPEAFYSATSCELAWTNLGKRVRIFRHLWHGMMRKGKDHREHPTQKPTELMKWCLCLPVASKAETILDPFMGSGTTLRAAKDLNRKAIGIEIEEKYCEIAAKRLAQEVFNFS